MKRILAIALALIMVLAALTGCMSPQKPSGSEGEQNPSGKRLPIVMTIAETLPSCVAFEYKDEKPYCFYAYDTEGKLYRVFWNDFTGLSEKDVIVVDHNDDIKTLTYDEYPSGWTPQYELTAISIKKENDADENIVSHIQIKSGDNTIHPFGSLLWSKTDNGDGTFTEVNASMLDTDEIVSRYASIIPKLVLNESVSYSIQVNGQVERVYLLTPNEDGYSKSEATFEALSNLENGTYYVAFNVLLSGNCDPEAPQNSSRYEDIFCLVVGEQNDSTDKDHPVGYPYRDRRVWDRHHPDDSERYPYFSITVPELGDALIEHREDGKIYFNGEYLAGGAGNGCESFYLADIDGDYNPELCFGMNTGSGAIDLNVVIFDYKTREPIFSLSDRMNHDYFFFVRNGKLCVKETEYMQQEAVRTGTVIYDGLQITVSWDKEVNANPDRDKVPEPGQPVS